MRRAVNFALDRSALAATAGPGFSGLPTRPSICPTGMPRASATRTSTRSAARTSPRPQPRRPSRSPSRGHVHLQHGRVPARGGDRSGPICAHRHRRRDQAVPASSPRLFSQEFTPGERVTTSAGSDGPPTSPIRRTSWTALAYPALDARLHRRRRPRYRRRIAEPSRSSGGQRLRAYGSSRLHLARRDAPVVAFADITADDFFSARIGCQVFQPIYGMDLGALCRRG